MELVSLLVHFLLKLDERWLRPLTRWVPDLPEVLANPAAALKDRDIEIGPWTRYIRGTLLPVLLLVPALFFVQLAESPVIVLLIMAAWLLIAMGLVYTYRG